MRVPVPFPVPPADGDPHHRAAHALARRLADAFPGAGVAVSGSVAQGTHTAASDLDLLVVDDGFLREMQFATESGGIAAAIVCLRASPGEAREREWSAAGPGAAWMMGMVRSARVVHDPAGQLARLQEALREIDGARDVRRADLLNGLRESAGQLLARIDEERGSTRSRLLVRLLSVVIDAWYLREGLTVGSKRENRRAFARIAERDAALAGLLRAAVPVTGASRDPLARAAERVLGFPQPPRQADTTGS